MARKPRNYIADIPCHVVQRGNDRQATFYTNADYGVYLESLRLACEDYECELHCYVLMTNHVHLLLTPRTTDGISKVMQSLGRRYVRYINGRYARTGTLWEGRHHANLIQSTLYLLRCYRYIELNPVRAGIVDHPNKYRWSSYHYHGSGAVSHLIEPHPEYRALGRTDAERQSQYRALMGMDIEAVESDDIRHCIHHGLPLGDARFKEEVETLLGRRLEDRGPGRPRKTPAV